MDVDKNVKSINHVDEDGIAMVALAETLIAKYAEAQTIRQKNQLRELVKSSGDNQDALLEFMCAVPRLGSSLDATHLAGLATCGEILRLTSKGPIIESFNFLGLPEKVQQMVFSMIHDNKSVSYTTRHIDDSGCNGDCEAVVKGRMRPKLDLSVLRVCRKFHEDFFKIFYAKFDIHFDCTCSFAFFAGTERFQNFANKLCNKVSLTWVGTQRDIAFSSMAKFTTLKALHLGVNYNTRTQLSQLEKEKRQFFTGRFRGTVYLCDADGFDSLLKIKGLEEVHVKSLVPQPGQLRTSTNPREVPLQAQAEQMQRYLEFKILPPKEIELVIVGSLDERTHCSGFVRKESYGEDFNGVSLASYWAYGNERDADHHCNDFVWDACSAA